MGIAEIIILLAGAILFTVSFIIPDKNSGGEKLDEEEEKKIIREMLDEEMEKFRFQMEEATQEVIDENRDKMERAMDRITNEKMSAVNEYSDTVIEQIHKNHDEAMFLYDMLNNKHSQVKNTAAELNQLTKSAKVAGESVAAAVENNKAKAENSDTVDVIGMKPAAKKESHVTPRVESVPTPMMTTMPGKSAEEKNFEGLDATKVEMIEEAIAEATVDAPVEEKKPKRTKKAKAEKKPVADAGLDLMFATDSNSANSNDRILQLHNEGKSNMAIAKELGLGIGEVKLVIDLFEGI